MNEKNTYISLITLQILYKRNKFNFKFNNIPKTKHIRKINFTLANIEIEKSG